MKKLFIPLLITMTGLAAPSVSAQGYLLDGGTELDATTTQRYLQEICGLTSTTATDGTTTWSFAKDADGNYVAPSSTGAGDVFFVEVNDYWKGVNSTNYDFYTQISKGVKKITAVNTDSKQATSTGTFYTHPATDVNKFFFIVRRDSEPKSQTSLNKGYQLAFAWYDEWSYVSNSANNGEAAYNALEASWSKLMDGTPFPAPHNCDTSLETNHYIALDGADPANSVGHDFTAYLYVPNNVSEGTNCIFYSTQPTKWPQYYKSVSTLDDNTLVYAPDGTFKKINEVYPDTYYYSTVQYDLSSAATVAGRTLVYSSTVSVPYVFFYAVELNTVSDTDITKKDSPAEGKSIYQVALHWSTVFDKFASAQVQAATEYGDDSSTSKTEGIQEHYVIERSYDNSTWEIVSNDIIVSGNDVKSTDGKAIIDTGLEDKDSEFGFTVWYRVTSIVEKNDGYNTKMSTTTSNVVRVEIPGKVPFKLTLDGKGTSVYNPVSEENTFTNTIISSDSKVENSPEVKDGSTLSLYRVDAKGEPIGDPLITVDAVAGNTLADLAKQIKSEGNPEGKYTDVATLKAGDGNEAAYRLIMEIPANGENSTTTYVYSNILRISNAAIANGSFAAHRSGTPDAATCALQETFHNEITFKASANQVGTGYYIYRDNNATPIMKLNYTEQGFRVDRTSVDGSETYYTPDADGMITIIDIVDTDPIAVGESGEETIGADGKDTWKYAVAYYDNDGNGNTYGSEAKLAEYKGERGELVLNVEANIEAANFSQPGNNNIYTVVTITWNRTKEYDDTKPSFYEIYLKKNGIDRLVESAGEEPTTAPIDLAADPSFEFIDEVEATKNSYTFTETFVSAGQSQSESGTKYTENELIENLTGEYEVYVKMTTTEGEKKNSFIAIPEPKAGKVYTGIEGIEAQEIDVKVVNGVVEVSGVNGLIKVIDAKGAVAAEAEGNGAVTEIEGLETGVYVVTANNMKPTKILIK